VPVSEVRTQAAEIDQTFLYGMKSTDPLALVGAVAVLLGAVTLGVTLPRGKHLESILWSRYGTSDRLHSLRKAL
jgi:hypothetical protein